MHNCFLSADKTVKQPIKFTDSQQTMLLSSAELLLLGLLLRGTLMRYLQRSVSDDSQKENGAEQGCRLVDKNILVSCCVVNNLIQSLKSSYYTTIINENSTDQRVLFNTVSKLLQKQSTARFPSSCSDALDNSFADYFIDKIDRIHATLIEKNSAQGNDANDVHTYTYNFICFSRLQIKRQHVLMWTCLKLI